MPKRSKVKAGGQVQRETMTEEEARAEFGPEMGDFLREVAEVGNRYQLDALCVMVLHKGQVRIATTGAKPAAREKMRTVGLWLSAQVELILSQAAGKA